MRGFLRVFFTPIGVCVNKVELSLRLKCIADMVSPGTVVFDVGCDHGFLSIYLVESGIADSAVALDVVKGPLKAAAEHVKQFGLEGKIECRLSDGLHNIATEELRQINNKTLIIAGMGGPLILSILSECPDVRDMFDEIIVGPQSKIEEFRIGLEQLGLAIIDENMILEDGKYYQILKMSKSSVKSMQSLSCFSEDRLSARAENKYGSILLAGKHPVLKEYLEFEYGVLQQVIANLDANVHSDRYEQVCEDLEVNRMAFDMLK